MCDIFLPYFPTLASAMYLAQAVHFQLWLHSHTSMDVSVWTEFPADGDCSKGMNDSPSRSGIKSRGGRAEKVQGRADRAQESLMRKAGEHRTTQEHSTGLGPCSELRN